MMSGIHRFILETSGVDGLWKGLERLFGVWEGSGGCCVEFPFRSTDASSFNLPKGQPKADVCVFSISRCQPRSSNSAFPQPEFASVFPMFPDLLLLIFYLLPKVRFSGKKLPGASRSARSGCFSSWATGTSTRCGSPRSSARRRWAASPRRPSWPGGTPRRGWGWVLLPGEP